MTDKVSVAHDTPRTISAADRTFRHHPSYRLLQAALVPLSSTQDRSRTEPAPSSKLLSIIDCPAFVSCWRLCKIALVGGKFVLTDSLSFRSEFEDWRLPLASLLQPIPFPEEVLANEAFAEPFGQLIRRIGTDPRCEVHLAILGVREGKEGWFHLVCPGGPCCMDDGDLFACLVKFYENFHDQAIKNRLNCILAQIIVALLLSTQEVSTIPEQYARPAPAIISKRMRASDGSVVSHARNGSGRRRGFEATNDHRSSVYAGWKTPLRGSM